MGLVKVEDYRGSEIGNAVMDALDIIGIVYKLNINGYHLSVSGVTMATPDGMLNDTPDNHRIVIERYKHIGNKHDTGIKGVTKKPSIAYDVVSEQEKFNIDFDESENYEITHGIKEDPDGSVWYNHRVEFEVQKLAIEAEEVYVKRLFETIADYVVRSFESMYEEM